MPLYEYRCPDCGNEFESLKPSVLRDKVACTRCGARATRRVSMPVFRMAVPLYLLDGGGNVLNKNPDSSSSDERNPGTPPDYPNIQV